MVQERLRQHPVLEAVNPGSLNTMRVLALRLPEDGPVIVAAVHRMSLLHHFDMVVLMKDGRVQDAGSVDQLLDRQPLFREMLQRHGSGEVPALA